MKLFQQTARPVRTRAYLQRSLLVTKFLYPLQGIAHGHRCKYQETIAFLYIEVAYDPGELGAP